MPGIIVWKGPSEIDGESIVLIAIRNSTNRKTGEMIQTYILRSDVDPVTASRVGADKSICGDCRHRHTYEGTCYVNLAQGPNMVWSAMKRGNYDRLSTLEAQYYLADHKARLGTYGDPAAVPFDIWDMVLARVRGITGYTHQWRNRKFKPLKKYCMASCDTQGEHTHAKELGWRTFTVISSRQPKPRPSELLCPASEQAGKVTTCEKCLACGGHSSRNRQHVYIPVHGLRYKQERFNTLIQIGG